MAVFQTIFARAARRRRGAGRSWIPPRRCAATVVLTAGLGLALPPRLAPAALTPTIFPVLRPHHSIDVPLTLSAARTYTWVSADGTQHLLLRGQVRISVGYRRLNADAAAVWLQPLGAPDQHLYRVTIYLRGQVVVREGAAGAAVTTAPHMLVSTRINAAVRLAGGAPVARVESAASLVRRGRQLMRRAAQRPHAIAYIPTIVIQPIENALSRGWIARGANNQVLAAPAPAPAPRHAAAKVPHRPLPTVFATGNKLVFRRIGRQQVTVVEGEFFLLRQAADGRHPLELRADNAVLFSPAHTTGAAPPAGAGLSQKVQGVYLDGDVTITYGNQTVHAAQVYYDFTTNRAIMLHAVLNTVDVKTRSPLYLRAEKILQLAQNQFAARSVQLSTDAFHTPHYYIGASAMTLRSLSGPAGAAPGAPRRRVWAYTARNTTVNFMGLPVFYWPYLAGTTTQPSTPLRKISVGYSGIYGASVRTVWDPFELTGLTRPKKLRAGLTFDYFSRRGVGVGLDGRYHQPAAIGDWHSFFIYDHGTDNLGANRDNLPLLTHDRGWVSVRHMQRLSREWTLAVEGSYISDPNFLEQYFWNQYATAPQQQTSVYLEQQHDTEAFTVLGQWNLNNFVANADLEDNEFSVQRYPEVHYRRIGDKLLGLFTWYSDNSSGLINDRFSEQTPAVRGLQLNFPGMNPNETFAAYYLNNGWTDRNLARGDSRQELDLPLAAGPIQFVPFVTGRVTYWDTSFPVTNNQTSGNTTRLWGDTGFRSTITFWRVYPHVHSRFFDVHGLRHIVQPEVDLFFAGTDMQEGYLQPFDRNVEGITDASGAQFALHQIFQTKRGAPGQQQIINWITLNVAADMFWHKSTTGPFNPANPQYAGSPFSTSDFGAPIMGYYDFSQPELSQVSDSINGNFAWRAGANVSLLGDESYNVDQATLEELSGGVLVDQSPSLSYYLGNSYIHALNTDQWMTMVSYRLTRKYSFYVGESYDFSLGQNITSTLTIVRKLPQMYTGLTFSYDAYTHATAVFFSLWPAGYPSLGLTSPGALAAVEQQ